MREELYGSQKYFDYKDRCIFCDIIIQELEREIRMIEDLNLIIREQILKWIYCVEGVRFSTNSSPDDITKKI